ncbi:recombinase family protein [Candidatus Parcubacteria bacterium]|nr:recombinase family protein [Candidatus Parcubacteria bacterium]
MKRAVLYARVSSDIQKEEGTIKSQLFELRQQIARDGNTITKEYIDDGWPGGLLSRPALDQLRSDLKHNLFDVVYFHAVDRIARKVAYQQIIIADILKYQKQIIINGKDYIENPENELSLTVLGAVAEFERAKFVERSVRGRRHKVRQGIPATGGNVPYGYTHVKKTDTKPQHIIINEERAATVRYIYETYANTEISINELTRKMQESDTLPARGNRWSRSTVHFILTNTAYYGEIHYYTVRKVRATGNLPRHIKFKTVKRDPSEELTISVPPILSKDLWDRVQVKLGRNKKVYRNTPRKYLLSGMVQCARDGKSYTGYSTKWGVGSDNKYRHYQCNHNTKMAGADYSLERDRCTNKSIVASRLETGIWLAVINEILNPVRLKTHIEVLRTRTRGRKDEYCKKLASIEKELKRNDEQKGRLLDLYTEGQKSKEIFAKKLASLENEEQKLRVKQAELVNVSTLIPNPALVRKSIAAFCERMNERLRKVVDFSTKRKFLLDLIDSIIFDDDVLLIRGFVPLLNSNYAKLCTHRAINSMRCPTAQ